ncbi:MAG TPA: BTAD domain-containing putative transcriptional regulator [Gemmatimonadaceae bacterium]|nr:BTAD domain-containing putative transcriptional regulator [Gemmatimonadaceae bacterium]
MLSRVALLGPVSLSGPKGTPLRRASQQRRMALLALVASAPGQSISRDRLLGFLWPDRDERTARHLLADSVYVLRKTLGDRSIVASGETLRLSPDLVWTDVAEFRSAIADARWTDALQLYRGDFLDGFYVRNAADFDQWVLLERERLRGMAARAASTLASSMHEAGRMADATAAAERALELAPGDETSFRNLIRLLIETSNQARAQSVARTFIEYLASEVGVAPSAETARLLRELNALRNDEPIVVVAPQATNGRQTRKIDLVTASLIMRGRHQWHQRTRGAVERAISYFTAAVERDPRAVEAWCGLADSWTVMGGRGYAPLAIAIGHAAAAADHALRLDDTVSATSASIGGLNILRRRWHDAELALRRSIALDPRNADAHHWLSMTLLSGFGLREEAVREQTIAVSLNPVLPMLVGVLGWQRYLRGEYDLSRSNMEPAVDLNADFEEGHAGLARAAARLGDETTVIEAIEAGLNRRSVLRGDLLAEQASAFAILGDTRRARRLALEASRHEALPMNLALAWASVGDAPKALDCLGRESFLVYWSPQAVWWDPRFDQIRDEARFARVLERVERVWSSEWR